MPTPSAPIKPKYYFARRDTRWDVYPSQAPLEVVAHDYYGFWKYSKEFNGWWKTPTSYVFRSEIEIAGATA